MQSANDLKQLLFGINHKSYPAYKSTRGAYQFPRYTLSIDHVQGDPFAAPSRVSVHITGKTAAFPTSLYDTYEKRVALQDYLLRQFARAIAPYSFRAKGSGKSGLLGVSRCGQEILERTACVLNPSDGSLIVNMARVLISEMLPRITVKGSFQWPHHRLAGTDPLSLRLPAGLRGKIASVPQSGSESMRRCRPSL